MAQDYGLTKHLLEVLKLNDGHPMDARTLTSDTELASGRALSIDRDVRPALVWLRDQGWTASRTDRLQRELWWVTEAGRSAEI
jgi:hypothetical protein